MVEGDLVVIEVRNAGDAPWAGEPVAVEAVVTGPVETPSGEVEVDPGLGQAGWTTRAGAIVSRCVFDPTGTVRPGEAVRCGLPRLGRADGPWALWLTGFTGGLPALSPALGDDTPAVGVVSVATSRSLVLEVAGTTATVVEVAGRGVPEAAASAGSDSGGVPPIALVVAGAAGLGALTAGVLHFRRNRVVGQRRS